MLESLAYVHKEGVVHCDVKPVNFLANKDESTTDFNQIKLCDFGFSRIIDPTRGKSFMLKKIGSVGYMAPELKVRMNFDFRMEF